MSGLCVVVHWDDAPIPPDTLQRMTQAAPHRGHPTTHTTPHAHLAHQTHHHRTTPTPHPPPPHHHRQRPHRQPPRTPPPLQPHLTTPHPTDAQLILAAHHHWGHRRPPPPHRRLRLRHPRHPHHTLHAARDPMGMRPLYYHHTPQRTLIASEVKQILAVPDVDGPALRTHGRRAPGGTVRARRVDVLRGHPATRPGPRAHRPRRHPHPPLLATRPRTPRTPPPRTRLRRTLPRPLHPSRPTASRARTPRPPPQRRRRLRQHRRHRRLAPRCSAATAATRCWATVCSTTWDPFAPAGGTCGRGNSLRRHGGRAARSVGRCGVTSCGRCSRMSACCRQRSLTPAHLVPTFLRPEWAARTGLLDIIAADTARPLVRGHARAARHARLFRFRGLLDPIPQERLRARYGMTFADPWADRRVVEFVLAVPPWRLQRPSEPKRLARLALGGLLPSSTVQALGKADAGQPLRPRPPRSRARHRDRPL
jgi:hypothetical protein